MVTQTRVTAKGHTSDWIRSRVADIWAFIGEAPSPDITPQGTSDRFGAFRRRQRKAPKISASHLPLHFHPSSPATLPFIDEQKAPFERLLKTLRRLPATPNDSSDRLSSRTLERRRYFESLLKLRETLPRSLSGHSDQISKAAPVPSPQFPYQSQRPLYHKAQQMNCWLQFVTVPTVDTPGSLLVLHFDSGRYFFGNLSEGTQRACIEHGIRNAKAREVFLTGKVEWKNIGGLLGYVLSMGEKQAQQEAERKSKARGSSNGVINRLGLHGGPNLLHTLAVGRRFIFRKNMPLTVDEFKEVTPRSGLEPTWVDDNLKVWQMGISKAAGKTSQSEQRDADDLRKKVVSLMFDSDWRTDALMEQPLKNCSDVAQIFIRNPDTRAIERYTGPRPPSPAAEPNLTVLTMKPWPGALVPSLPAASLDDTVMCYIAKSHPRRGRFNAEKAMELGIAPGKAFSRLTNGESVQAPDGTIVRPGMVLSADRPGLGLAVISLPSQEYIDDFVSRPEWASTWVMDGIEVFCWQLGPGLSDDPRVLEFRERFPNAKHFISSPDSCPNRLSFSAAAANSIRLSRIAPEQFKVPIHDNVSLLDRQNQPFLTSDVPNASKFIPAVPRLKVQVAPAYKLLEEEAAPLLNTREVVEHIPAKVLQLAREGRRRIEDKSDSKASASRLPGSDAEIITLGTGSSTPSKYRNLSGTLLRVPGYGSYLLDCGEGTLGQLRRAFEPEELEEVFKDLRMIWISHLHADHHLGTISVIRAWHEAVHGSLSLDENKVESGYDHAGTDLLSHFTKSAMSDRRLAIVSHSDMLNVLFEYSSAENFGFAKCLPMKAVVTGEGREQRENLVAMSPERSSTQKIVPPKHAIYSKCLGLKSLSFCRVSHCYGAMAVSLEFANGFKISYSGDCRPSKRFAEIGAGSTVLIHEATFDDELQGDAHAKKHSTTSEAIGVGAAMGAKGVILTHFSQRYQKTPVMSTLHPLQVDFEDAVADPGTAEELAGLHGNDNNNGKPEDLQGVADVPVVDAESEPLNSTAAKPRTEKLGNNGPTLTPYVDTATTSTRMTAIPSSDMNVCVAFDYMRVRVDEIADMAHYTPALVELFNEVVSSQSSDSEGDSVTRPFRSSKKKDKIQERMESKRSYSKSKDTSTDGEKKQTSPGQSRSTAKAPTPEKNQKENNGRLSQNQLRRERGRMANEERAAAAQQQSASPPPPQPKQPPNQLKRKSSSSPAPPASSPPRTIAPPSRPAARSPRPLPPSKPRAGSWDSLNDMVAQQIREDERDVVRGASEGRGVQA